MKLGLSAALLSLFALAPAAARVTEHAPPLCAFRLAVGRPCPFCGLTRAFAMAVEGRWEAAFDLNPMWPVAAVVVLLTAGGLARDAVRGSRATFDSLGRVMRRWWIPAAALAGFGLVRLLS